MVMEVTVIPENERLEVSNDLTTRKSIRKRQYRRLENWQREILEQHFATGDYWPNKQNRMELAGRLDVAPRKVQVWFQNQRAKFGISIRNPIGNEYENVLNSSFKSTSSASSTNSDDTMDFSSPIEALPARAFMMSNFGKTSQGTFQLGSSSASPVKIPQPVMCGPNMMGGMHPRNMSQGTTPFQTSSGSAFSHIPTNNVYPNVGSYASQKPFAYPQMYQMNSFQQQAYGNGFNPSTGFYNPQSSFSQQAMFMDSTYQIPQRQHMGNPMTITSNKPAAW